MHLKTNRSVTVGDEDFFINLQEMLPNLPIFHWLANRNKKVMRNCWKIPNLLDLHFNNKYWQVKETKNGTFYLYAAYYDVRKAQRLRFNNDQDQMGSRCRFVLIENISLEKS